MRKYESPLMADITPDTWKNIVHDKLGLEVLAAVLYDARRYRNFFERTLEKYLISTMRILLGKDRYWEGKGWIIQVVPGGRKAGLDEERLLQDMGPAFVEKYRKPDLKWDEIRVSKKKEE
jgi:hypothetical protein